MEKPGGGAREIELAGGGNGKGGGRKAETGGVGWRIEDRGQLMWSVERGAGRRSYFQIRDGFRVVRK